VEKMLISRRFKARAAEADQLDVLHGFMTG